MHKPSNRGPCALSSIDPAKPRPALRAAYGLSEPAASCVAPGRTTGIPLLTDEVLRSTPGTICHDRDIVPRALLATTAFWTDWMRPQGFISWTCIIVGRDRGQVTPQVGG